MSEHDPDTAPDEPSFSALFHDLLTPLSVLDSHRSLARKYLERLAAEGGLDEETTIRLASVLEFLDIGRAAGERVLERLSMPRDAIWANVLDRTSLDLRNVMEQVIEATKPARRT